MRIARWSPGQARTRALMTPSARWTIPEQIAGPHAGYWDHRRAGRSAGPADGQGAKVRSAGTRSCHDILKVAVEQARSPSVQPRGRVMGAAQSAVDGVGLTVNIGGIVAGEKQGTPAISRGSP